MSTSGKRKLGAVLRVEYSRTSKVDSKSGAEVFVFIQKTVSYCCKEAFESFKAGKLHLAAQSEDVNFVPSILDEADKPLERCPHCNSKIKMEKVPHVDYYPRREV